MGIPSKSKSENWGMGFLLVFFPDDQPLPTTATSSPSSFTSTATPLRRTTPNPHHLTTTQSAFSICALLFFLSLLLFSLQPSPSNHLTPRRLLSLSPAKFPAPPPHALQKLGLLHRRGTKGMHDLVVGHVTESLTPRDLRFFLRLYHFSNFSSKSDLVLIFPSRLDGYESVIFEEVESFSRLNSTRFVEFGSREEEPLWGKKSRTGNFTANESKRRVEVDSGEFGGVKINSTENETTEYIELARPSYGSIVSFVADELDPENSLSGFLDHVAMGLRRWACYPMLLGRVRRSFKHVILIDVREVLLLDDPLGRVRNRPSESVQFSTDAVVANHKHGRKHGVNSALVLGGVRGIRRLANAMLTEIVRSATATQHKRRNSVSDSAILNQLVVNEHVLKSVNVKVFTDSVPEMSSLGRINSDSGSPFDLATFTAVRRGNGNVLDVNSVIRKHICSLLPVNSSVYSDC